MKVSIWQQFSSNHSSAFTVVGFFKSPEQANEAADKLRLILSRIAEWRIDPDRLEKRKLYEYEGVKPTPIELEIGSEYGTGWNEYALDWIFEPDTVNRAVIVHDNILFVTALTSASSNGPYPFDALTEKFGGRVATIGEAGDVSLYVSITCKAPDGATLDHTYQELHTYFSARPLSRRTPWKVYPPGRVDSIYWPSPNSDEGRVEEFEFTLEEWIEAEDWYRALEGAAYDARSAFYSGEHIKARMEEASDAFQKGDREKGQAIQNEVMQQSNEIPEDREFQRVMTSDKRETKMKVMLGLHGSMVDHVYHAWSGQVSTNDLSLNLTDVHFFQSTIATGFPALLDYLRNSGFTAITYEFREERN